MAEETYDFIIQRLKEIPLLLKTAQENLDKAKVGDRGQYRREIRHLNRETRRLERILNKMDRRDTRETIQLEKQETQQIGLEKGIDTKSNQLQGISSIVTAGGGAIGQFMNPLLGEYGIMGRGASSMSQTSAQLQTNQDLLKANQSNKVNTFFGGSSLSAISSKTWIIAAGFLVVILFLLKKQK